MIILWVIFVTVVIFGGLLLLFLARPTLQTTASPLPSCDVIPSSLPDISNSQFQPCYTLDGESRTTQWYDPINDWIVADIGSDNLSFLPNAFIICSSYCSQLQLPNECATTNTQYNQCLETLSPNGCTDPTNPVARNGSRFLYVIQAGDYGCFPSA